MKIKAGFVIVASLLIGYIVLYFMMAVHVIYAVIYTDKGTQWIEVYRSVDNTRALKKYKYLINHKAKGVRGYILVDEENGNSIVFKTRLAGGEM